jgi:hypothetical protein
MFDLRLTVGFLSTLETCFQWALKDFILYCSGNRSFSKLSYMRFTIAG